MEKYEGFDMVIYRLNNDTLEYEGHDKYLYKWSDFTNFEDYQDFFRLNHPNQKLGIMIPKLAVLNEEDYLFFYTLCIYYFNSSN